MCASVESYVDPCTSLMGESDMRRVEFDRLKLSTLDFQHCFTVAADRYPSD